MMESDQHARARLPRAPMIMLVDDDVDFLDLNAQVLKQAGYRVVCFANRNEAFESLTRERPALIITDLMMESLDTGFTFSRQMREDPKLRDIPIIIVTAVGSQLGFDFRPRTKDDLSAMRADAFFEKPVAPKRLLAKIDELLRPTKPQSEGEQ